MTRAVCQSNLQSSLGVSIVLIDEYFGEIFKQMQDILIDIKKVLENASR